MPLIPYPNVPNVPGVPQVLRQFAPAPPPVLVAALGLASIVRSALNPPVWGIFKPEEESEEEPTLQEDGTWLLPEVVVTSKSKLVPQVLPDSILAFDYKREWAVTTSPTQQGGFADYNRVAQPFEVKFRLSKGGTESDRRKFLEDVEGLNSTQLYDVVTPEKTYHQCNLIRIEIARRGEKGAFYLSEVDVFFREIRPVTAQYSRTRIENPRLPTAGGTQNNGTQQGQEAVAAVPESVTE